QPETHPVQPAELVYQLGWAWGTALPLPNAEGWQVVTATGYTVQVHEGYVTAYSAQLVECDHEHPEMDVPTNWGIQQAWAGHGDDSNATEWYPGRVENLAQPTNLEVARIPLVPRIPYC